MELKKIILIIISTAILGCAVKYKPPTSGDVAQIRFQSPSLEFPSYVIIQTFSNDNCDNPKNIGKLFTFKWAHQPIRRQNMMDPPPADSKKYLEELIPAGKVLYFTMKEGNPYYPCVLTFSFLPEKNAQYEATYSEKTFECYLTLHELILDNEGKVVRLPVDSFKKNIKECSPVF